MRFTVTEVVRGATRFDSKIDGDQVQSARVFMDVSLEKNGEGWGHRTEGYKCASLDVVDRIKHNPFPFKAEVTLEQKATGKNTTLVVVEVKPLAREKAAA
jgi:hypothetical protein